MREASIVKSRHGNLQPQIKVTFNEGTHHRAVAAEIYRLAADIELASQPFGWIVVPEPHENIVYLELLHATEAEANQGLEVLQRLCP